MILFALWLLPRKGRPGPHCHSARRAGWPAPPPQRDQPWKSSSRGTPLLPARNALALSRPVQGPLKGGPLAATHDDITTQFQKQAGRSRQKPGMPGTKPQCAARSAVENSGMLKRCTGWTRHTGPGCGLMARHSQSLRCQDRLRHPDNPDVRPTEGRLSGRLDAMSPDSGTTQLPSGASPRTNLE